MPGETSKQNAVAMVLYKDPGPVIQCSINGPGRSTKFYGLPPQGDPRPIQALRGSKAHCPENLIIPEIKMPWCLEVGPPCRN